MSARVSNNSSQDHTPGEFLEYFHVYLFSTPEAGRLGDLTLGLEMSKAIREKIRSVSSWDTV